MKRSFLFFLLTALPLFGIPTQPVIVESSEAQYNGELITLLGNVSIEHAMGTITAQKAILRRDAEKMTNLDFPWIEIDSQVLCTFAQGGKMLCDHLEIDHTLRRGEFSQVVYSDEQGEVYADKAWIDYDEETLKPTLVTLVDHVRLSTPANQYALADFVLFYPETQFMILEGKENRVLFVDTQRDVTLSAKTIHAQRDKITNRDSVKGLGDVRFTLSADEIQKMKKHLKLTKGDS